MCVGIYFFCAVKLSTWAWNCWIISGRSQSSRLWGFAPWILRTGQKALPHSGGMARGAFGVAASMTWDIEFAWDFLVDPGNCPGRLITVLGSCHDFRRTSREEFYIKPVFFTLHIESVEVSETVSVFLSGSRSNLMDIRRSGFRSGGSSLWLGRGKDFLDEWSHLFPKKIDSKGLIWYRLLRCLTILMDVLWITESQGLCRDWIMEV